MKNFRSNAFTLAEVLITLGIIGVVAAMTLPSLIGNYKKQVYYNQFLKAANTLENYVKMACVMKGYDDIENCDLKKEKILPFDLHFRDSDIALKVVPGGKIIPLEDIENSNKIIGLKCLDGSYAFDETTYARDSDLLVFPDGISINYEDLVGTDFMIDTNGPFKGPNTIGRDIFFFWPFQYEDDRFRHGIYWVGLGKPPYIDELFEDNCNIKNEGSTCAGKLLQERKMNY